MFLIQGCSDSISEHKLQQVEDPNFLESPVWQWNPSSALLITMIIGNTNQSCMNSHVHVKPRDESSICTTLRCKNITSCAGADQSRLLLVFFF